MKDQLLIYGASGFTGTRIAEMIAGKLLSTQKYGLVLAGRDKSRIAKLALQLGVASDEFSAGEGHRIDGHLARVRVLLNAAGPFDQTALSLASACVRTGTHYLDVSGEIDIFQMLQSLHNEALARGVMIMPGVGFSVVASDCLTAALAAHITSTHGEDSPAWDLKIGFSRAQALSRGSIRTVLKAADEAIVVRRHGKLTRVPMGSAEANLDLRDGEQRCALVSMPDALTAGEYGVFSNVACYAETGGVGRFALAAGALSSETLLSPILRGVMNLSLNALHDRPTEEDIFGGTRHILVRAENQLRQIEEMRIVTPDGYVFTRDAATNIAMRVLAGEFRSGFRTPGKVYGAELLDELRIPITEKSYPTRPTRAERAVPVPSVTAPTMLKMRPAHDPEGAVLPPYEFRDVRYRTFRFFADRVRLREICDTVLNIDAQLVNYDPLEPFVYLDFVTYGSMTATKSSLHANTSQMELIFRFWVKDLNRDNAIPTNYVPMIFVDNDWSLMIGREILGYPKRLASFTPPRKNEHLPIHMHARGLQKPDAMTEILKLISIEAVPKSRNQGAAQNAMGYGMDVSINALLVAASPPGSIVIPNVHLRQLPDPKTLEGASYQALMETTVEFSDFKAVQNIPQAILHAPPCLTTNIQKTMGLTENPAQPNQFISSSAVTYSVERISLDSPRILAQFVSTI